MSKPQFFLHLSIIIALTTVIHFYNTTPTFACNLSLLFKPVIVTKGRKESIKMDGINVDGHAVDVRRRAMGVELTVEVERAAVTYSTVDHLLTSAALYAPDLHIYVSITNSLQGVPIKSDRLRFVINISTTADY